MRKYIISNQWRLPAYADESMPKVLFASAHDGVVDPASFSAVDLDVFSRSGNEQLFKIWNVPGADMVSSTRRYRLHSWSSAKSTNPSDPLPARALNFYDHSENDELDLSTGIYTVPEAGLYRHNLSCHVTTSGNPNCGLFIEINGFRHQGSFLRLPSDDVYGDYFDLNVELAHEKDDQVAVQFNILNDGSASGVVTTWAMDRVYKGEDLED